MADNYIEVVWLAPTPKEWNYLDFSIEDWNTIDSLLLTWNEFERGGYNG